MPLDFNMEFKSNNLCFKAFDTLTPKSIMQRYTSLLLEQKRLIISGPPSCGKTIMAQKLANFLVEASGDCPNKNAAIVTFTIQVIIVAFYYSLISLAHA